MPHLIVELSPNLDDAVDQTALCAALRDAMIATGVFPLAGIRVRTHRCGAFAQADGDPRCAFVHMTALIGAGRPPDVRREAARRIFGVATAALSVAAERFELSISFEMREIDPIGALKVNPTHARLSGGRA